VVDTALKCVRPEQKTTLWEVAPSSPGGHLPKGYYNTPRRTYVPMSLTGICHHCGTRLVQLPYCKI